MTGKLVDSNDSAHYAIGNSAVAIVTAGRASIAEASTLKSSRPILADDDFPQTG